LQQSVTNHVAIGFIFLLLPSQANSLDQEPKVGRLPGHSPAGASSKSSNSEQTPLLLSVLVFNHAEVDPAGLEAAKETAATIYRKAEIDVEWRSFSPSTGSEPPPEDRAVLPLNLILPGRNAYPWLKKTLGLPKTALGFALTQPQDAPHGDTAYVFVNLVEGLAQAERPTRLGVILGHIVAHELGHLLLGRGHSPNGLMSAEVGELTLRLADANRLHFTRAQANRVREVVRERVKTWGGIRAEER
jgi:hypothetical protein